jgi:hypothetical protein
MGVPRRGSCGEDQPKQQKGGQEHDNNHGQGVRDDVFHLDQLDEISLRVR